MSTTGKTMLVAVLLIALGVVCVRLVQTACTQDNPSFASCTREETEDCDSEDRRNYEKECGVKSPDARPTTPRTRTRTSR